MNKRIVFFDFDGVVVDSFNLAFHIMKLRETDLTASEYRERFKENIYKHFDPGGKPETSSASQAFRSFFGLYTPQVLHMEYMQGVDAAIAALAAAYTLIVNSSTPSQTIRTYLELHGLASYFTDTLGAESSFNKTEKIQSALREHHVLAHEAVFITDTLGDIREAAAANVASIAVTWGYHDKPTLEKGQPFAIVSHPQEIVLAVSNFFNSTTHHG